MPGGLFLLPKIYMLASDPDCSHVTSVRGAAHLWLCLHPSVTGIFAGPV